MLSVYSQNVLFEPERCFFPNCASQINLVVTLLTGAFPLSFSLILSLISSRFGFRVVYVENKNNNANTSCRTRERLCCTVKDLHKESSTPMIPTWRFGNKTPYAYFFAFSCASFSFDMDSWQVCNTSTQQSRAERKNIIVPSGSVL